MQPQQPQAGDPQSVSRSVPTLAEASRYWFKLGWISFGGPAGQIAMMHHEIVERRRWIGEHRFLHALNYCMLLPGPEAQQLATYIGWLMHGVRGGVIAGLLFVLPSLLIMIALAGVYLQIGAQWSADLLYGVKPVVVAIVLFAAWRIGSKVLRGAAAWTVTVLSFLSVVLGLPFPLIIFVSGLAGWLLRSRFSLAPAHGGSHGHAAADGDDDALPAVTRSAMQRSFAGAAIGLLLGILGYLALRTAVGPQTVLVQMAEFFTRAALVTFGGAYAVMPYVFQQAVGTFQWLTPAQMIDGLALGETTPGPLIMVVAFIGYLGASSVMPAAEVWSGVAGACVATFFTFLPSFVFILAGGPLVERTREDFRLAGPLSAITAAVVGAIAHLGVGLSQHVHWPQGFPSAPDAVALLITLVSLYALVRNRIGMIPLVLLGLLFGAVYRVQL